jgi:hypothetical protein
MSGPIFLYDKGFGEGELSLNSETGCFAIATLAAELLNKFSSGFPESA